MPERKISVYHSNAYGRLQPHVLTKLTFMVHEKDKNKVFNTSLK